jgi:large subunit ribosomal protein L28
MKNFDHNMLPPFKNRLTKADGHITLRSTFCAMSKVCSITGSRVSRGSVIHRRGMAKKKGGVGRHVTKNVTREFRPNLHEHRIWLPELKKFVRIRVTARGLKTINKNGAYQALRKAGVIAA